MTQTPRDRERPHLDDVSKAIIEQLQQDGRRSYAAIGKVVGLSEAAVRQRVQRLLDGGVMQVVAVTDPLELGFARQAMVGIRVQGPLEPVADALAALPEVDYVVVTAGSYDLLVEVVCESDEHLLELISQKIRTIDGGLLDRDLHVPQAAQADLLVGRALSPTRRPGPTPGCRCGTRPPATPGSRGRHCPATPTPTWRSSAPATPACGPPTTSPGRPDPADRGAGGRGRGVRRVRAQRRLVLGAVPGLAGEPVAGARRRHP